MTRKEEDMGSSIRGDEAGSEVKSGKLKRGSNDAAHYRERRNGERVRTTSLVGKIMQV